MHDGLPTHRENGDIGVIESTRTKPWAIGKAEGKESLSCRGHPIAILGDTALSLLAGAHCAPGGESRGWIWIVPLQQRPEPMASITSSALSGQAAMETPESCLVLPWVWPSSLPPPPSNPVLFLSEGRRQPDTFLA